MKKILFSIIGTGLLLGNVGCQDSFDLKPSTSLTAEEAIIDEATLQLAVFGVYEMLTIDRGGYASDFSLYADCTGGDTTIGDDNGQISPFMNFSVGYTHPLADAMYFALYEPCAFANMALEAAAGLEQTAEITRLMGELKAIRAILHFDVARVFAQLPTVAGVDMNAANSGVVIIDQVYPVDAAFTRSTLTETYDFIVDELKDAMTMMNTAEGKAKNTGSMNYWSAEAALARAYLYLGDWDNAYTAAVDVINNGGYTLFTHDSYLTEWSKVGASEFISEFTTSAAITMNTAQWNSLGSYTNPEGYAEVMATEAFFDLIQNMDDDDIRKESVIAESAYGYIYKHTIKYPGQDGASNATYQNNPRILRLAEMYYIASEAALKNNDNTNALKYYNDLRRSRYDVGSYTDATTLTLNDILDDRRVELFCEGHRMWDLKRNNIAIPSSSDPSITRPANDDLLVLPIPLRELDISPELEQNPGHGDGR